jgi:DUF971 family protein
MLARALNDVCKKLKDRAPQEDQPAGRCCRQAMTDDEAIVYVQAAGRPKNCVNKSPLWRHQSGRLHSCMAEKPRPTALTLHQQSKVLEVGFDTGETFRIPFELMRVCSPSAEVQGHGPGQEVLQTGKRGVGIAGLETVGHYAVQPSFDDGHSSGIFSWDYLYFLGSQQEKLWRDYEARLAAAGLSRDAPMAAAVAAGCGHHH